MRDEERGSANWYFITLVGIVLIVMGIIHQERLHWLVSLGFVANSVGMGFIIVPVYFFLTQQLLPIYNQLKQICPDQEMSSRLKTQKILWVVWLTVIAYFLSTSSNVLELILRHRSGTLTGVALAFEVCFFCTMAFVAWCVQQTENEAELLLSELEGKPAPHMAGAPDSARFLLLLIPIRHREHLVGDLEEEFTTVVLPRYGLKRARAWYWWQVLASVVPLLWAEFKRAAGLALLWKTMR